MGIFSERGVSVVRKGWGMDGMEASNVGLLMKV
jgi:hypothetical protein